MNKLQNDMYTTTVMDKLKIHLILYVVYGCFHMWQKYKIHKPQNSDYLDEKKTEISNAFSQIKQEQQKTPENI